MNTNLTTWSVFARGQPTHCGFTEGLYDWCFSQIHLAFQILSCDKVLSDESFNGEHPDLILINSRRRGDFPAKMLLRIVNKYPLSLVLEITGEWCFGDTRSGVPLPVSCRFDVAVAQQRLPSMLSSRQRFLQIRNELGPLASVAELSAFWNRNTTTAHCSSLNVIASDDSEREALGTLLAQEGFNVHSYPSWNSIAEDGRSRAIVYSVTDRRELGTAFKEIEHSFAVIISSHFNSLDTTFFKGKNSAMFLRKPFLAHDLVQAISNVQVMPKANAA